MHIGITHNLVAFLECPHHKWNPTPRKQPHVIPFTRSQRRPPHQSRRGDDKLPSFIPLAHGSIEVALINLYLRTLLQVLLTHRGEQYILRGIVSLADELNQRWQREWDDDEEQFLPAKDVCECRDNNTGKPAD